MVNYILNLCLDQAWDTVSVYDREYEGLRARARVLKGREPVQEAWIGFFSDKIAMNDINKEMMDNVVKWLLTDISNEVNNVNELAKNTALKIITGAFKSGSTKEKSMNSLAIKM